MLILCGTADMIPTDAIVGHWLTDAARASTIRETLLTIHREQAEAVHGAG